MYYPPIYLEYSVEHLCVVAHNFLLEVAQSYPVQIQKNKICLSLFSAYSNIHLNPSLEDH